MKDEVELFTLAIAQAEQEEWGEELKAFASMVSVVRERHFGKTITDDHMLERFEALVQNIEIDEHETN